VPQALLMFKTVFLCMTYYDPLRPLFPKLSRFALAQGMVSICHTYLIIFAPLLTPDVSQQIWYGRVGLTYFMWDTLIILGFTFATTKMYLIHHAIVIFICYASMPEIGYYAAEPISNLYYYAECSNAFLTLWSFANRNKNEPWLKTGWKIITPLFAITYLPLRVVAMPWYAWKAVNDVLGRTDLSVLQKQGLTFPMVGLVAITLYYAQVVARITYKRMRPNIPNETMGDQMKYSVRPRVRVEQIYGKYHKIQAPTNPEFWKGSRSH
jgi:hypothetical protein